MEMTGEEGDGGIGPRAVQAFHQAAHRFLLLLAHGPQHHQGTTGGKQPLERAGRPGVRRGGPQAVELHVGHDLHARLREQLPKAAGIRGGDGQHPRGRESPPEPGQLAVARDAAVGEAAVDDQGGHAAAGAVEQQGRPDFGLQQDQEAGGESRQGAIHDARPVQWAVGGDRFPFPGRPSACDPLGEDVISLPRIGGHQDAVARFPGEGLGQLQGQIGLPGGGRLNPDIERPRGAGGHDPLGPAIRQAMVATQPGQGGPPEQVVDRHDRSEGGGGVHGGGAPVR